MFTYDSDTAFFQTNKPDDNYSVRNNHSARLQLQATDATMPVSHGSAATVY